MRTLLYVPMPHHPCEADPEWASVKDACDPAMIGRMGEAFCRFWDDAERWLAPHRIHRLYSDGAASAYSRGQWSLALRELQDEGSRWARTMRDIIARGAIPMKTEARRILGEYESFDDLCLDRRDEYIAHRIDKTLRDGETGILTIGNRHSAPVLRRDCRLLEYYPLPDVEGTIEEIVWEYERGKPGNRSHAHP